MAENPMISLVLYYFSADLKTTVFAEARDLKLQDCHRLCRH